MAFCDDCGFCLRWLFQVRRFGQSEEVHPGDPVSIHQQFGAVHKDEASIEQDIGAEYNIAGDDNFPRD